MAASIVVGGKRGLKHIYPTHFISASDIKQRHVENFKNIESVWTVHHSRQSYLHHSELCVPELKILFNLFRNEVKKMFISHLMP